MKLSSIRGGERRHQGLPERYVTPNYLQDERMGHKVHGRGREVGAGQHLCTLGETTLARGRDGESRVPPLSAFKAPLRMHTMKTSEESSEQPQRAQAREAKLRSFLISGDPSNLSSGKCLSIPDTDSTQAHSRGCFHARGSQSWQVPLPTHLVLKLIGLGLQNWPLPSSGTEVRQATSRGNRSGWATYIWGRPKVSLAPPTSGGRKYEKRHRD